MPAADVICGIDPLAATPRWKASSVTPCGSTGRPRRQRWLLFAAVAVLGLAAILYLAAAALSI
ncbi:MAG: hypothetical protein ACYSTY_14340 [Planctomycetota bacterium]